jgi:hypothetical protein
MVSESGRLNFLYLTKVDYRKKEETGYEQTTGLAGTSPYGRKPCYSTDAALLHDIIGLK